MSVYLGLQNTLGKLSEQPVLTIIIVLSRI